MGNVACVTPTLYDDEFKLLLESEQGICCSSVERANFLRVHVEDRAHRCILDPNEVTKALIEQARATVQREMMTTIVNDDDSSLERVLSDLPVTPARDHLDLMSTDGTIPGGKSVVTSVSAATQVVGNRPTTMGISRPSHRQYSPPTMKGNYLFNMNDDIEREISAALKATSRLPLSKAGCNYLLSLMDNDLDVEVSERLQRHTSVLNLTVASKCLQFYRNHLSRLLPNSEVSRLVETSLTKARVTPPRGQGSSSFNLSTSSMEDVDFGIKGPESSPVCLLETGAPFMDLAIAGSLGLNDRRSPSKIVSSERQRIKSPEDYIVLFNRRSGYPMAVCALKAASTGSPVVRIFATKRRVYGQRPAATTRELGFGWTDSLSLFNWAEMTTKGSYPGFVKYNIFMATGSEGRFEDCPSYCGIHAAGTAPEVRVVGRTGSESYHSGCALVSLCEDEKFGVDHTCLKLSVSRGIDPALMLCFCAFVDESLEFAMRLQL